MKVEKRGKKSKKIRKKSPDDNIAQHIERCIEISIQMMDISFVIYWNRVREYGKEDFDPENESFARDCYLQGATSMAALFISAGMPLEFLDAVEKGMRGAKKKMIENNIRGE